VGQFGNGNYGRAGVDTGSSHGHSLPKISGIGQDQLAEIVAATSDLSLLISPSGEVISVLVNPGHPLYGGLSHWSGMPLSRFITTESHEKLSRRLAVLAAPPQQGQTQRHMTLELNHSDGKTWEFPVRYSLHRFGDSGNILMLGRDLRPIAEMQQQLVLAQVALERDYETQREMDTRYRILMEATRDAVLLMSMSSGRVADLNTAAAVLLGGSRQDFLNSTLSQEFEGRKRGEFLETLSHIASADSVRPIELVARRSQRLLRIVPKLFRAAGDRMLLCRLESPDGDTSGPRDTVINLERLFNEGVDSMLFLDEEGIITAANESFLKLTDSGNITQVRGRSFADFLARGSVDLRVLLDNAKRARQLRMYATRLLNEFNGQIAVEVSATYLNDKPKPGFGIILRDTSRSEMLRRPGFTGGEDGMRSVMELVGSSTLKDIVAETADVVEKMCIQTAVDLTRNNRAAAAEMLGLSRQSLYVKLRKFGMISKDED
jgi:transcriptional regulator PpsR